MSSIRDTTDPEDCTPEGKVMIGWTVGVSVVVIILGGAVGINQRNINIAAMFAFMIFGISVGCSAIIEKCVRYHQDRSCEDIEMDSLNVSSNV